MKGDPLVFAFKGKAEDSGAHRHPGCVTFQIYMCGTARARVMEWLNTTCPKGYEFADAKVWRNYMGKSHRDLVPVVHIFDRGHAALFKMVFGRTEQAQRDYNRQQRTKKRSL